MLIKGAQLLSNITVLFYKPIFTYKWHLILYCTKLLLNSCNFTLSHHAVECHSIRSDGTISWESMHNTSYFFLTHAAIFTAVTQVVHTWRLRQNDCHFIDIFISFLCMKTVIFSVKFVPKLTITNNAALVHKNNLALSRWQAIMTHPASLS